MCKIEAVTKLKVNRWEYFLDRLVTGQTALLALPCCSCDGAVHMFTIKKSCCNFIELHIQSNIHILIHVTGIYMCPHVGLYLVHTSHGFVVVS